jgi:hypothetical protein
MYGMKTVPFTPSAAPEGVPMFGLNGGTSKFFRSSSSAAYLDPSPSGLTLPPCKGYNVPGLASAPICARSAWVIFRQHPEACMGKTGWEGGQ